MVMIMLAPFWFVFTLPGRFLLWRNFYFPSQEGFWYGFIQKDSKLIMALYSLKFWIQYVGGLFVLAGLVFITANWMHFNLHYSASVPVFWRHTYALINTSHLANTAANFDMWVWSKLISATNALLGTQYQS